jgi:hypothetical protein
VFGEEKAINLALVFQFRASDALGYVGGFRQSGNITNISYTKTLGVDIQALNQPLYSFDFTVSCKYTQDSLVTPVYVPNIALTDLVNIRNQQIAPSSNS